MPSASAPGSCPSPADQPAVRLDLGGWISGPALPAEALEAPTAGLADPGTADLLDGHHRPVR